MRAKKEEEAPAEEEAEEEEENCGSSQERDATGTEEQWKKFGADAHNLESRIESST